MSFLYNLFNDPSAGFAVAFILFIVFMYKIAKKNFILYTDQYKNDITNYINDSKSNMLKAEAELFLIKENLISSTCLSNEIIYLAQSKAEEIRLKTEKMCKEFYRLQEVQFNVNVDFISSKCIKEIEDYIINNAIKELQSIVDCNIIDTILHNISVAENIY